MPCSRRKQPFSGITTRASEKEDKREAHQRERYAIRQRLPSDPFARKLMRK